MFSRRLAFGLSPNVVARAVGRARAAGAVRFDLTTTNPTTVGIPYPPALIEALSDPGGLVYEPAPLGTPAAREAVAAATGATADRLLLTASTSEAYGFLFKLLCDPGDIVLTPRPSYPLFELLTALEGVGQASYRLDPEGGWCIDRDSLVRALTPHARAILVVSPNNPTGSRLREADREWLVTVAREHELALISDEVFADYPLATRPAATSLAGESRVLTFTLGGLSKSAGLPQLKLAWTRVSGPGAAVDEALSRLEIIADSYLSVATPVQLAARSLLALAAPVRHAIQHRLERNLQSLRALAGRVPSVTLHDPEGGWSVVMRMPAVRSEDDWVLGLLEQEGVLVHPGYFFDLEGGVHVIISLLPEPEVFDAGISAFADAATRWCS